MNQTITIITPYRNAENFIRRFVESLQAQTRTDWICLMVDDGSSDNGPAILREAVADDSRFRLLTNDFPKLWSGPASARNCALSHVSTPLVAFCDVDDIWHPEKLERQIDFHLINQLDLSVSAYGRFIQNDSYTLKSVICPPAKLRIRGLHGRNPIPMLTVIINADFALQGFQQIAHEDFFFWLQLLRSKSPLRYGCCPMVLAFYCIHSGNLSRHKLRMPIWTYRVYRRLGQTPTLSCWFVFVWLIDHFLAQLKSYLCRPPSNLSVNQLLKINPLSVTTKF